MMADWLAEMKELRRAALMVRYLAVTLVASALRMVGTKVVLKVLWRVE